MIAKALLLIGIFVLGFFASTIYAEIAPESPLNIENPFGPKERASPSDWIPEDNIHVYKDRVVIDITNPQWASFTDTNSMDPVLDENTNAIQIVPKTVDDIKIGDIVSYNSDYSDSTIIHRVAYKGEDEEGTYFVMKGDNNPTSDPGKVRFEDILRVSVMLVY